MIIIITQGGDSIELENRGRNCSMFSSEESTRPDYLGTTVEEKKRFCHVEIM